MSVQVDTDTTERLTRDDTDYLYAWNGTTNYRMQVSVLLAGIGVGTVTSVSGTANEIASSGGSTPVISLPATIDLSGKTSLKIPTSATPTVNADGIIAIDTTVADFSHGILKYYGTEELGVVALPISQFSAPTDGWVVSYNAGADEFQLVAKVTASDLQSTGLDVDAAGFRGVPQNAQTGNYTTVASDAGKHIYHASGAGAGDTYTIDSNANVAYEVGTAITFINLDSNAVSIAITSDTMYLAGTGSTGTRTLAQYGVATAVKITSTAWIISGSGIS